MDKYASAEELVRAGMPHRPVIATRPHLLRRAASFFKQHFPGKVLYAVKANDAPAVIEELYQSGIKAFDVASLVEIQKLQSYSNAELYLMNPVKPRYVISEAYHNYGVRNFSLDSHSELTKILEETGNAKDLTLLVRVSCNGEGARIALDDKFGISDEAACDLLMAARKAAVRLGVTFHVGSQAMEPERYSEALTSISSLIARSGVLPDIIDVGGGFPSIYPGLTPPPLTSYMNVIDAAFEKMNVVDTCELLCEPGRALVAEAGSMVVRVEHRKGQHLYINDGSYGCLHDAAHYGFVFPAKLLRPDTPPLGTLQPFAFYGPTCDSADYMPGPFYLPDDVQEGDFIEIGQLGAYGKVMTTLFNGFGRYKYVELEDEPIISMYGEEQHEANIEKIVAFEKHV